MGVPGSTWRVTLAKPFLMRETEVTLCQYRRVKMDYRIEGAADGFNADNRPGGNGDV